MREKDPKRSKTCAIHSSLSEDLLFILDGFAREHGVTRSKFIAIIIEAYVNFAEEDARIEKAKAVSPLRGGADSR